jgi:hypothetical protein
MSTNSEDMWTCDVFHHIGDHFAVVDMIGAFLERSRGLSSFRLSFFA